MNSKHESSRRTFLRVGVAGLAALFVSGCGGKFSTRSYAEEIAELERRSRGRLGVGLLSFNSGDPVGYRLDERFGMCSTFKLVLAAVILKEAEEGRLSLDSRVNYTEDDMVFYSPITSRNLERGFMTVAELAETTQKTSDNAAANLLLDLVGGPAGFTDKLRQIGDETTRLDRYEPEMNLVPPGEVRDTTTPAAMARTVRHIFSGEYFSLDNRRLLRKWMEETRTGLARLRAGFPSTWNAGDKTGTGIADSMPNKYNDIAVVWQNDGTPDFILTAYYEADDAYNEIRGQDEAVLRAVGRITAEHQHTAA
ncbi:MAG: class A beta-lactamase [Woeseiaceae bacterium]|nr:class A beta-lactamase [Woeseiaceae bacterium]